MCSIDKSCADQARLVLRLCNDTLIDANQSGADDIVDEGIATVYLRVDNTFPGVFHF